MKMPQTYGPASVFQDPKSTLGGLTRHVSSTVLACTLVIGATGSATAQQAGNGNTQAAPSIPGVIGKVQ